MTKQYSIAEARQQLSAVVHELEKISIVELTRRNKPVAVLLSIPEFTRLRCKQLDFWQAYSKFRIEHDLKDLGIDQNIFADVRDRSPGRKVRP